MAQTTGSAVSPRLAITVNKSRLKMSPKDSFNCRTTFSRQTPPRAGASFLVINLGFRSASPQALCCRPLPRTRPQYQHASLSHLDLDFLCKALRMVLCSSLLAFDSNSKSDILIASG